MKSAVFIKPQKTNIGLYIGQVGKEKNGPCHIATQLILSKIMPINLNSIGQSCIEGGASKSPMKERCWLGRIVLHPKAI